MISPLFLSNNVLLFLEFYFLICKQLSTGGGNQRRGRGQGRNRQNFTGRSKDVLDFEGEYDFEQANAEFQELEGKLAKIKISGEQEEAPGQFTFYSIFDNIYTSYFNSCTHTRGENNFK